MGKLPAGKYDTIAMASTGEIKYSGKAVAMTTAKSVQRWWTLWRHMKLWGDYGRRAEDETKLSGMLADCSGGTMQGLGLRLPARERGTPGGASPHTPTPLPSIQSSPVSHLSPFSLRPSPCALANRDRQAEAGHMGGRPMHRAHTRA